jgi:four helix bundle protein
VSPDIRLPHEKLLAYQLAIQLLGQAQEMRVVDARLRDQMPRAEKSVCLNIAEAVGRFSDADKKRVYAIARGECCETAAASKNEP